MNPARFVLAVFLFLTVTLYETDAFVKRQVAPTPTTETFTFNGNVAIPDGLVNSTTMVPLNIPNYSTVNDINVEVNISTTWAGDVTANICSPSNTTVVLIRHEGRSGDNIVTTFDDEAAQSIVGQAAPFTGSYKPKEALNTFYSQAIGGTWNLKLSDDAPGDMATLNSWSLVITGVKA